MQCKTCRCEMKIVGNHIQVEGDKSPDTETKVYRILDLACRARQCPEYGKIQVQQRIELK